MIDEIYDMLKANEGLLVAKEQLPGYNPYTNIVQVNIHKLRKRIGKDKIITLRGRGYVLQP